MVKKLFNRGNIEFSFLAATKNALKTGFLRQLHCIFIQCNQKNRFFSKKAIFFAFFSETEHMAREFAFIDSENHAVKIEARNFAKIFDKNLNHLDVFLTLAFGGESLVKKIFLFSFSCFLTLI
jgi:hypothetical protein